MLINSDFSGPRELFIVKGSYSKGYFHAKALKKNNACIASDLFFVKVGLMFRLKNLLIPKSKKLIRPDWNCETKEMIFIHLKYIFAQKSEDIWS